MVITLLAVKGITYPILWGYNYDFIPKLNNKQKLVWHRTEKSFHMDIKDSYYSYVSFPQKAEQAKEDYLNPERDYRYYELSMWTSNIEFALRYIDDVVKKNIPFMIDWYQCVQTIEDVSDELDKQVAMPSPYNHRNKYLY